VLVLDQDPRDSEAAELLSNMLERADRFDDLVAVLYRRLSLLASEADAPVFMQAALQLGQVLEGGGLATEALPVYESILDWDPRDPEALRKLVGHLKRLGSGRLADCLECLIAADTSAAPTLARGLVELRDKQGDPAGVLRALEAAFLATPTDRGFRDRLVKIYEERKEWAELARVLRKAVETAPSDRALFRRLLAAYQAGGDDSEALGLLDSAIAARPRDAELLSLRAQSREKTGDDAGALSDLEAASAIGGRYVDALVELLEKIVGRSTPEAAERHTLRVVEVLLRAKRPEQTHKELERLLARSPNHRAGLERLSSLASAAGDWVTAAKAYARLIPLVKTENGELLRITLALGDACVRTEHPGDARVPIERALAANPENAELVAMLERIYEASRDFTRLADSLVARAEQQQNSTYKTLLLLRAAKFLLQGAHDLPRAQRTIEQARATDPESLEALVLWAKAQLLLRRPHEVLLVLRQTLKANRAKRSPLLAHVHLEIGRAHLALDELFEALDALKAAFNIDRRNGEVATLLGLVALDLDDEKTAERALSTVTLLPLQEHASDEGVDYETQATAFYHLASMAHAKGDLTKARRMASKASALDPTHEPAKLLQRA